MVRKFSLVFLFLFSLGIFPRTGSAGILTFPGASPCDTTLQACINGANSSDIIEIATNNRIDEPLDIAKSLTLRAATGFTPMIGNPDPTAPDDVIVEDAGPGGGSVSVVFNSLNFDAARLSVQFVNDSGHHFEMTDSRLTHNADSNNDNGVTLDMVRTTSTVELLNNFIATPGQPFSHFTGGAGGDIQITLQGNLLTTTNPANSHEGIELIVGGAENLTMNLFDNVIYGVAGCNCGANSGIFILTRDTATVLINATNNTIDQVANGPGVEIRGTEQTSLLTLNFFNNTVSNVQDEGFDVEPATGLTLNNGFNNFFNTSPNVGFTAGQGTISVDPLFIDPAGANYRLQAGSLLIDAGTETPVGGLPTVDADNLARVVGGSVDIGAYEAAADLELVKLASPGAVNVGEDLTYTLTVTNLGPYDTAGVQVTDTLPVGLILQSATPSQGSCTGTSVVVCELGALSNGASAKVTLVAIAKRAGTVTNAAIVTSQIPDPNPDNDTASVAAVVTGLNPLISGGGCGLTGGNDLAMGVSWGFFGIFVLLLTLLEKRKRD